MHNPVDGGVENVDPLAEPHAAFVRRTGAEQFASAPWVPVHIQFHGPVPLMAEAMPVAHNSLVGAEAAETPDADPHRAPFGPVLVFGLPP